MKIVKTRYGEMHIIAQDNTISFSLNKYGEWAQHEINLISNIINKGNYVLDIGAFIGTHTLAFSAIVGDLGKVFSFEPRPEIYNLLFENLKLNNNSNVSALNIGLSDTFEQIDIEKIDLENKINFGGLSIIPQIKSDHSDHNMITLSTIDNLGIEKIDFIKLDVEGMERKVLDGAIKSLTHFRPSIFSECNSLNDGNDLLLFCKANSYQVFGFLSNAFNNDNFNRIEDNSFGNLKELSLLLLPEEKTFQIMQNLTNFELLPILNIEDLILPLLHKPQYPFEILINTNTSSQLGINYPSPSFQQLSDNINIMLKKMDEDLKDSLQQANLYKVKIEELKQKNEELKQKNEELNKGLNSIAKSKSWQITKPLRLLFIIYKTVYTKFKSFFRK